jgi:hypothetical protein
MDEATATWSSWRGVPSVLLASHHVKKTVLIAVMVGTCILRDEPTERGHGRTRDRAALLKSALTYLTPLLVSNVGVLSGTRRRAVPTQLPPGT